MISDLIFVRDDFGGVRPCVELRGPGVALGVVVDRPREVVLEKVRVRVKRSAVLAHGGEGPGENHEDDDPDPEDQQQRPAAEAEQGVEARRRRERQPGVARQDRQAAAEPGETAQATEAPRPLAVPDLDDHPDGQNRGQRDQALAEDEAGVDRMDRQHGQHGHRRQPHLGPNRLGRTRKAPAGPAG